MRIEDFLEKKEYLQIALLKKLIQTGGQVSYEDLRSHLGISKASLDSYLAELDYYLVDYGEDCQIKKITGSLVELVLSDHFTIETIYIDYVKSSLKYQLIDYVFTHQEFTAVKIVNDLAISESSLFRKIKEINQVLKEFQLQIKNGRLHGEELQIRYFYFKLYWFVTPYDQFQEMIHSSKNQSIIAGFEKELAIKVSDFSRKRISLWFAISKKRANVVDKSYRQVRRKIKPYENDRLYQQVRQLVLLYFSRYSIEIVEEESILHFIFLTTQSILSEKDFFSYDLVRSRRTPTALADTLLRETILHYYLPRKPTIALENQISYYLSQTNGTLYFFMGALEIYDQAGFSKQESQVWGRNIQQLSVDLLDTALDTFKQKKLKDATLQKVSLAEYINILAIVNFKISKEIHVGIELDLTDMSREIMTQILILRLKSIIGITVEEAEKQKKYDLIIRNDLRGRDYEVGTEIYIISELCSNYDLSQIKFRIDQLKT